MYPDWDMALRCSAVLDVRNTTVYARSSAYAHFSMIDEADQTKLPDFSLKLQEHKCLTVIIEGKVYIKYFIFACITLYVWSLKNQ